jgi:hypothetical protein
MLRNTKKDEEFDEESGDESPLIVPGSRSRENKRKKNSTSSYSPLTWVVMLAFVVGIGVGTCCRVAMQNEKKSVSLFVVESRFLLFHSRDAGKMWGLAQNFIAVAPLLLRFVAIALPRSINIFSS